MMAGTKSKAIEFYKMSGSGNDFIIIDNRNLSLKAANPLRSYLCQGEIADVGLA